MEVQLGIVLFFVVSNLVTFSTESHWSASDEEKGRCLDESCTDKPNILFFLGDDVGYGDFQSYGHPTQEWGGVDRMAGEGMKFTQWYSPGMACSPSRMAMLTGRYAIRSGMFGSFVPVFFPTTPGGLSRSEVTLAESLKSFGYVTGMVGKWHLGINKETSTDGYFLPRNHGFDYVGTNLPHSNTVACNPKEYTVEEMARSCFLYNDSTIIEQPINFTTLTDRMVDDAKYFISRNRENNFFMFFSFAQTHNTIFCNERFCGKSKRGSYGDNINEMAWGIEELLNFLDKLKLSRKTIVIFLSDHGAKMDGCPLGGDNGPFRGGKGSGWEGGVRVPAVVRWPGVIPERSISSSVVSTLDLYPTFVKLAQGNKGSKFKLEKPLDGTEIQDILRFVPTYRSLKRSLAEEEPRILYHYCNEFLYSVRYGDLKVHYITKPSSPVNRTASCSRPSLKFFRETFACDARLTYHSPPLIYNVAEDPGELIPLDVSTYQDELNQINELVAEHRASIEQVPPLLVTRQPHLQPCCNPPNCTCNYNKTKNK